MLPVAVGVSLVFAAEAYLLAGVGCGILRDRAVAREAVVEEQATSKASIDSFARGVASTEADAAVALESAATGGLAEPAPLAALKTAGDHLDRAVRVAPPRMPQRPSASRGGWTPFWTSAADTALAQARTDRLVHLERWFGANTDKLNAARKASAAARDAVYASAGRAAAAQVAAHPDGSYESHLGVQHAIDQRFTSWPAIEPSTAAAYHQLADAVAAERASADAEAARRDDPAERVKLEAEAFARSLSHGIHLDFAWAYTVNGHDSNAWYAGTTVYHDTDGGWATITLTTSIGQNWDDVNARAVVVHEVGHSQAVLPACRPVFDGPDFKGQDEQWATAWAIAAGYDVPGSGIEAYGRPSDAQIAAARTCQ